jgi:hypothetical protein
MSLLFALVAFFLSISLAHVGDTPCATPDHFYSYDDVIDGCFNIPFNATIASHTLQQLTKAYQLYAFRIVAKNPPDPHNFNPPVDLFSAFNALSRVTFKTDFQFQEALKAIFLQVTRLLVAV